MEDQLRNWELVFKTNIVSNLLILQHFKIILSKIRTRIIFFAGGGAAYEYPLFPSYAVSKISSVKIVENLEEDYKNNRDFIIIALSLARLALLILYFNFIIFFYYYYWNYTSRIIKLYYIDEIEGYLLRGVLLILLLFFVYTSINT